VPCCCCSCFFLMDDSKKLLDDSPVPISSGLSLAHTSMWVLLPRPLSAGEAPPVAAFAAAEEVDVDALLLPAVDGSLFEETTTSGGPRGRGPPNKRGIAGMLWIK